MKPGSVIAVLCYNVLIFGATGYVVFWLNRSGWWFALALCLCASISKDDK